MFLFLKGIKFKFHLSSFVIWNDPRLLKRASFCGQSNKKGRFHILGFFAPEYLCSEAQNRPWLNLSLLYL